MCVLPIIDQMIFRRQRRRGGVPIGFYRFESQNRRFICGFGDGDFVRLRDEYGNVWRGHAEATDDKTVRFIFRDHQGRPVSGISDHYGVTLRDERGNTWRGYID